METCPSCLTPVASGATTCPTCGAPLKQGGSHDALPGGTLVLGKYRIDKMLGRGGFGITYKAVHSSLNRVVALKEYFPEGAQRTDGRVRLVSHDDNAKKEFLQEGQILGQLSHPSIVRVTDIFEENGTAYLVMDFVEGDSLGDLVLKQGPLSEQVALGYLRQAAQALKAVHAANLLHQDIKPDNLMRRTDGSIVLIDFGAARHFVADKTGNFDRVATPGYAPLEQYGSAVRRGPYTDFYALSATLYTLLGGGTPPAAPDRTMKPKLPGVESFSPLVQGILERGMAIKPTERPQNAEAFLALLDSASTPHPQPKPSPNPRNPDSPAPIPPGPSPRPVPTEFPNLERVNKIIEQLALMKRPPSSHFNCPICKQGEMRAAQRTDHCPQCRKASLTFPRAGSKITCPDCRKGMMERIDAPSGGALPCLVCQNGQLLPPTLPNRLKCPACKKAELVNQIPGRTRCPVCRQDALENFAVETAACPNCRKGRLQLRQKSRLLVLKDAWMECDHCHAEWDVAGKRWKLEKAEGPLANQIGTSKSPEEWEALAGRQRTGQRCTSCQAEFDQQPNGLQLAWTAQPTPLLNRTMTPLNWSKLAFRLPPNRGSHQCSNCQTEFDLEGGQMQVVQDPQGWIPHLRQRMPLAAWQRLAAGKQSPEEGYLCNNCGSEWDDQGTQVKLIVAGRVTDRYRAGTLVEKGKLPLLARGKKSGNPGALCRNCNAEWDLVDGRYRHLKTGEVLPLEGWQARSLGRKHPSLGPTCSSCQAEWVEKGSDWELVTRGTSGSQTAGTTMAISDWQLLAGGKDTPGEGFKCTSCRAELTVRKGQEYIQTYPRLGEARSKDSWMRMGQNLPDPADAPRLQREGQDFLRKAIEVGEWRLPSAQQEYPKATKASEAALFSMDAIRYKQVGGESVAQDRGTMWFTTLRMLYASGGKNTDIPYDSIEMLRIERVSDVFVAGIKRYDRDQMVFYTLAPFSATRHQGDEANITVDVTAEMLQNMVNYLSR